MLGRGWVGVASTNRQSCPSVTDVCCCMNSPWRRTGRRRPWSPKMVRLPLTCCRSMSPLASADRWLGVGSARSGSPPWLGPRAWMPPLADMDRSPNAPMARSRWRRYRGCCHPPSTTPRRRRGTDSRTGRSGCRSRRCRVPERPGCSGPPGRCVSAWACKKQ